MSLKSSILTWSRWSNPTTSTEGRITSSPKALSHRQLLISHNSLLQPNTGSNSLQLVVWEELCTSLAWCNNLAWAWVWVVWCSSQGWCNQEWCNQEWCNQEWCNPVWCSPEWVNMVWCNNLAQVWVVWCTSLVCRDQAWTHKECMWWVREWCSQIKPSSSTCKATTTINMVIGERIRLTNYGWSEEFLVLAFQLYKTIYSKLTLVINELSLQHLSQSKSHSFLPEGLFFVPLFGGTLHARCFRKRAELQLLPFC